MDKSVVVYFRYLPSADEVKAKGETYPWFPYLMYKYLHDWDGTQLPFTCQIAVVEKRRATDDGAHELEELPHLFRVTENLRCTQEEGMNILRTPRCFQNGKIKVIRFKTVRPAQIDMLIEFWEHHVQMGSKYSVPKKMVNYLGLSWFFLQAVPNRMRPQKLQDCDTIGHKQCRFWTCVSSVVAALDHAGLIHATNIEGHTPGELLKALERGYDEGITEELPVNQFKYMLQKSIPLIPAREEMPKIEEVKYLIDSDEEEEKKETSSLFSIESDEQDDYKEESIESPEERREIEEEKKPLFKPRKWDEIMEDDEHIFTFQTIEDYGSDDD